MSAKGQRKARGNKRKYLEDVLGKKRKFVEEEVEDTELLPKLPNDITMQFICTKLPWRILHVLSSVSRAWLEAIRSGEINDRRVRSGTTETLAFLEYCLVDRLTGTPPFRYAMAVYSLRDKAIYRLPIRPPFENQQVPSYAGRCVTIGGKVYILQESAEVWVLDVAGQKKWQACARMHIQRCMFGCAVFEGKIYVFGGYTLGKQFKEGRYTLRSRYTIREQFIDFSEVYDPEVDAWTKISPLKSWRKNFETWAGAVGDEILVDSGDIYLPGPLRQWRPIDRSRDGLQAYNPAKDSWRTIPPEGFGGHELQVVGIQNRGKVFTAHGRLHFLSRGKISVIDLDKKSVEGLHTCSFKTRLDNQNPPGTFWPDQVLVTKDGVLTKGHSFCPPYEKCRLYQSATLELGIGKKKIMLEEVECQPLVHLIHFSCMEPIEL